MAEIELPRAGAIGRAPPGRRIGLPTALNVPAARLVGDPGVRVPALGSGEGLVAAGQGVIQLGDALQQAADRITARQDAVERARDFGAMSDDIGTIYRDVVAADGFSKKGGPEAFGKAVADRINEGLKNHAGSSNSKAQLSVRAENELRSTYITRAAGDAMVANRKLVTSQLGRSLSVLVGQADNINAPINDLFRANEANVNDFGKALTDQEKLDLSHGGNGTILKARLQALSDRGGYAEVRDILDHPDMAQLLSPDEIIKIKHNATIDEAAITKAANAGRLKLREAEQINGGPLTAEQRKRLAGIAAPEGRQSLSDWVVETEKWLGRAVTPAEIAKKQGIGSDAAKPLVSAPADYLSDVDRAQAFAMGTLSPQEDANYQSAMTSLSQFRQVPNPDTGQMETLPPTLPQIAIDAFAMRGMALPKPGAPPSIGALPVQSGQVSAQPAIVPAGPQAEATELVPTALPSGKKLWDTAGTIVGIVSSFADMLAKSPITGSIFKNPKTVTDRHGAELASINLVNALRQNPRNTEGERAELTKKFGDALNPEFWNNESYRHNQMIALDDYLQNTYSEAVKTVSEQNKNKTTTADRQHAYRIMPIIDNFRSLMGVPPRVTDEKSYNAVPDGSVYIDPDGEPRTKKPEGPAAK